MAGRWISESNPGAPEPEMRRALMAACLDDLRDTLQVDHRRWRSRHIEGLAPLEGSAAVNIARAAETACRMLEHDLAVIRGNQPVAPVAVIAIATKDAYIDYINPFYPEQGAFATSGGLYHAGGPKAFPEIVICAVRNTPCDNVVAHELTHHALKGLRLPRWAEEGFTQMMEERVTGRANFRLDQELVGRHRERWNDETILEFVQGSSFHSPEDDMQELSYHLAQWVVRGELSRRPKQFFEFIRACRDLGSEQACRGVLGQTPEELVAWVVHSVQR